MSENLKGLSPTEIHNFPDGWDTRQVRTVLDKVDERTEKENARLLSISKYDGVRPRDEASPDREFRAESTEGYKIVQSDDLVVNIMLAWDGALGVSRSHGVVSPSYEVYRINGEADSSYLHYLFRSELYQYEFTRHSTGVVPSRWRLYKTQFFSIKIPYPPIKEQKAIGQYLDYKTAQIDVLIEKYQRLLELLEERRKALVHVAIQQENIRNLRLFAVADQVFRPIERKDDELYTPIGLYNRGRGIFHKEPTQGTNLGDSDFFWVKSGDLVISGQFAWEGAVALATNEDDDCIATHRYPILRGKPDLLNTVYLWAFFTTKMGDFLLKEHSRGAAGRNRPLNTRTLLKEKIPVPPVDAQIRVFEHVIMEEQFKKNIAHSIELFKRYRQALVTNAVTGKIELRDWEPPEVGVRA